jgi:hypothetical protein
MITIEMPDPPEQQLALNPELDALRAEALPKEAGKAAAWAAIARRPCLPEYPSGLDR